MKNLSNLCLFNRDELLLLRLDKIAFVEAAKHYSYAHYISGEMLRLPVGITEFVNIAKSRLPHRYTPFAVLGKAFVINMNYVHTVSIKEGNIYFFDHATGKGLKACPPKEKLRSLKKKFANAYNPEQSGK